MTDQTVSPPDEDPAEVLNGNWEFIDRVPAREEVMGLLRGLPDVWGVPYVDFIDYVQALPQRKKIKRPHPTNPALTIEDYVECYTLYMGVAGRIKMIEAAAVVNDWRVDFTPEPVTPTGIPGYLRWDDRLVYRVYVTIGTAAWRIGRKFGTAWVPAEGGSNAAGSNPYEKVETSALGRALAAWGFGVTPGSGIASVEEMDAIKQNRAHLDARPTGAGSLRNERTSRDDLLQEAMSLMERVRLERGNDEPTMISQVGGYLADKLGAKAAYDDKNVAIRWERVKDGQLLILANSFKDTLRRIAEAASPI